MKLNGDVQYGNRNFVTSLMTEHVIWLKVLGKLWETQRRLTVLHLSQAPIWKLGD